MGYRQIPDSFDRPKCGNPPNHENIDFKCLSSLCYSIVVILLRSGYVYGSVYFAECGLRNAEFEQLAPSYDVKNGSYMLCCGKLYVVQISNNV